MQNLTLHTEDQTPIAASLFYPERSNQKLIIINSATGVRQQIYFGFASYLSENGFTVITYDYRGIGLSKPLKMKNFPANMRIWGNQDFKTITDYARETFKNYHYFCIGHSVGALLLGMNPNSILFEKLVFIGTQKAFVGNLRFKTKVEAYLGFGIAQPLFTIALGYFPAQWFGLGESLPSGSAFDWRTLILHKKSTNKLLESTEDFSKILTQNVFVIRAEDDEWVTGKGVQSLMKETYPNMKPVFRFLKIEESEKKKIGHINFFRSYNRNLWKIILAEF